MNLQQRETIARWMGHDPVHPPAYDTSAKDALLVLAMMNRWSHHSRFDIYDLRFRIEKWSVLCIDFLEEIPTVVYEYNTAPQAIVAAWLAEFGKDLPNERPEQTHL